MVSVIGINYNVTSDPDKLQEPSKSDFVIEIPVQTAPVKYLDHESERKYFRRNLKLTLLPLLFCFLPVYLFFARGRPKGHGYSTKPQAYSILGWFRFLLTASIKNPILGLFNVIFLIFAGYVNVSFILSIYKIINTLIVLGEFRVSVLRSVVNVFRSLLVLLGVNGVWIYGHRFRYLLTTLGNIRTPEPIPDKMIPCVRFKLGCVYAVLVAIHGYHAYMFATERVKGERFDKWHAFNWLSYLHEALLASLFFPIYCGVAWTLVRHCTLLRAYLRYTATPAEQVIPAFKLVFKDLSTCYQWTTYYFSFYLSWAIVVHMFTISEEISDFMYLVSNNGGAPAFLRSEAVLIRGFVLFLILLALKIGLVFFVMNAASFANTEAHYLRVALNDYMSREAQNDMPTDTYQAYRVLKYYVESRLTGARPSVLQIPFFTTLGGLSPANFNTIIVVFVQLALIFVYVLQNEDTRAGFWGSGIFGKFENKTSS